MSEILDRTVFTTFLYDEAEIPWVQGRSAILAHDAALRLALETATANVEAFSARAFRAERERDDFVEKLKAAHKREDGYRIERDALLSRPAPPADAAREALRYCEEVFQHNEINRVDGEEIADRALVLIRRALSTPAPAPSAKEGRT